MKTNVYIDGLNLYNGAVKGTAHKWLDPQALVQALLPAAAINRIRYFTARVKARPNDPDAPNRQEFYLRALRTLPNLEVTEGQFKARRGKYPIYPYRYAQGAGADAPPLMEEIIKDEERARTSTSPRISCSIASGETTNRQWSSPTTPILHCPSEWSGTSSRNRSSSSTHSARRGKVFGRCDARPR